MKSKITWSLVFSILWSMASPAFAQETDLASLVKDMQAQMKQMQAVISQQSDQLRDLKNAQIQMAPAGKGEVNTAAPMSDYEFKQRLSDATGGADKWLKDLKFSGDLRLRYEAFHNSGSVSNDNSDWDRNRFRFRLRYGFEKKFNDDLKVGFSMATGESTTDHYGQNADPTSTNQTMGNLWDFKSIWVEKAYATYTPGWAKVGPVKSLELTGGKFTNPFERGSTDMVWDRDVKPEGAYETANVRILDLDGVKLDSYLTAGQFILQESATTRKDSEMYGFQAGLNPVFYTPLLERPVDVLGAVSFYDWSKYSDNYSYYIGDASTGSSWAKGNSVCSAGSLCTGFRVFEYYGEATISPYGLPITPFVDITQNTEAGRSTMDRNAWSLGTKIGKSLKKGDWQASYQYKWIGADAMPAFNDSDFGYRAYTGNEGSVIKLGYNLTDYMTINGAAYIVRNLNIGSKLDYSSTTALKSEQQSRFQLDLVWKF